MEPSWMGLRKDCESRMGHWTRKTFSKGKITGTDVGSQAVGKIHSGTRVSNPLSPEFQRELGCH